MQVIPGPEGLKSFKAGGSKTLRRVALGVAVGLALVMIVSGGKTVQPGNVGVKIRTLGPSAGVDPRPLSSGWHFNLLGERIVEYPVIQRTYTYTREADERGPENEEITFSDNNALPMTADVQLVMRVSPASAPAATPAIVFPSTSCSMARCATTSARPSPRKPKR